MTYMGRHLTYQVCSSLPLCNRQHLEIIFVKLVRPWSDA